jgi:hypothetical protein
VVSLYWSTASDPDEGQTLSDALSATQRLLTAKHVFLVCRGVEGRPLFPDQGEGLVSGESHLDEFEHPLMPGDGVGPELRGGVFGHVVHPLILGLDWLGGKPHAVTYDPRDGTWWSWGQPYSPADFPGAVIEEAWAVTW